MGKKIEEIRRSCTLLDKTGHQVAVQPTQSALVGRIERLIGLVKKSLFKVIEGTKLKFSELEEIILDVEVALNNKPLSYVEDDLQFPLLTLNVMLFGKDERHNLKHKTHELTVKAGDDVLIKGDEKNRGKWKMEIVKQIIPGRDRNVRAVKLKTGKGEMERTIQHLYTL